MTVVKSNSLTLFSSCKQCPNKGLCSLFFAPSHPSVPQASAGSMVISQNQQGAQRGHNTQSHKITTTASKPKWGFVPNPTKSKMVAPKPPCPTKSTAMASKLPCPPKKVHDDGVQAQTWFVPDPLNQTTLSVTATKGRTQSMVIPIMCPTTYKPKRGFAQDPTKPKMQPLTCPTGAWDSVVGRGGLIQLHLRQQEFPLVWQDKVLLLPPPDSPSRP